MAERAPLQWAGGVNLNVDPNSIRDDQLAYAKNAFPSLEGLLDKREPVQCVRPAFIEDTDIKPITLANIDPLTGYDFVLHYNGGDGEYLLASTLNLEVNPPTSPYTKVRILGSASEEPFQPYIFVNYKGRTIGIGGNNEGFYQLVYENNQWGWVKATFQWDAASDTPTAQSQDIPVTPLRACSYRGRMVYANFGPSKGNWLVFADRESTDHTNVTDRPLWAVIGDDVLAANGRHLEINAIQGENILAMAEVSLMAVGSQIQTALLLLTERSAILCTGETAQTFESQFTESAAGYIGDFQANKVNYEVGCVGQSAMCVTPYGIMWASNDDVWMMAGNQPVRIGTNIAPALRECPPSYRRWWSMACANGVVYLSLATQASTDAYSLRFQHWRLDLRQGPPQGAAEARWWGPQDYEQLPPWASPDSATGGQAHSLVVKRGEDGKDTVYSIMQADAMGAPGVFLITYNRGSDGIDTPFPTFNTARTWGALDHVGVGDLVMPTVGRQNGFMYICTAEGDCAGTEPTWPTVAGDSVVDGTATWTEIQATFDSPFRLLNQNANLVSATILLDIHFKEHNFGQPARDKVIRRADLTAYFGVKQRVMVPVIVNGGNYNLQLGPVVIGDFTLGRLAANNDLGLAILDTSAPAQEYQARTLRPAYPPGRADNIGATINTSGVVRGRTLQAKLQDGDGYVIDDTNNYIVWAAVSVIDIVYGAAHGGPYQAELTKGYYDNAGDLLTHIIAKMNAAQDNNLNGFTLGANPWSINSAYPGPYPYFTAIQLAFSARSGADPRIVFVFAPNNTQVEDTLFTEDTVFYLGRCKRLLATLGYDTSAEYSTLFGGPITDWTNGTQAHYIGEQLDPVLTSPTTIYGKEVMPYTRGAVVSVASLELEFHLKRGLPFSKRSR